MLEVPWDSDTKGTPGVHRIVTWQSREGAGAWRRARETDQPPEQQLAVHMCICADTQASISTV